MGLAVLGCAPGMPGGMAAGLPPTGMPLFSLYLAVALCVSCCIMDGGGCSVLLPKANSMFLAGGPPPNDRAWDDIIE
jgi:hypothetical protein